MVVTELALKAPTGVYSTTSMYKQDTVNMGSAYQVQVEHENVDFEDNIITYKHKFDARNLKYCKNLNLRDSSIS